MPRIFWSVLALGLPLSLLAAGIADGQQLRSKPPHIEKERLCASELQKCPPDYVKTKVCEVWEWGTGCCKKYACVHKWKFVK